MRNLSMNDFARALMQRRGLFVLGAGASAPIVPIASGLAGHVAELYWAGGSFPAGVLPHQDERARRVINDARSPPAFPAPDEGLRHEAVSLMSSGFVQLALRQIIGVHRDSTASPDNYRVFELFPPGAIWNYNLDGVAERCCGHRHRVLSVHGIIPRPFGSDPGSQLVRTVQDFDFPAEPATELLLETERLDTLLRLPWHLGYCDFVVLIGYTFGRNGATLNDIRSFEHLTSLLRREPKADVRSRSLPG